MSTRSAEDGRWTYHWQRGAATALLRTIGDPSHGGRSGDTIRSAASATCRTNRSTRLPGCARRSWLTCDRRRPPAAQNRLSALLERASECSVWLLNLRLRCDQPKLPQANARVGNISSVGMRDGRQCRCSTLGWQSRRGIELRRSARYKLFVGWFSQGRLALIIESLRCVPL